MELKLQFTTLSKAEKFFKKFKSLMPTLVDDTSLVILSKDQIELVIKKATTEDKLIIDQMIKYQSN